MKIGILSLDSSLHTIEIIDYFKKKGRSVDLVIIETAKRKKRSQPEEAFSKNRSALKYYLLQNDFFFLGRQVVRKIKKKISKRKCVSIFCEQKKIYYCKVAKHSSEETINIINDHKIDLLLLAGSSWLIKPNLINVPKLKLINIHNALLPKHRGLDSYFYSILNNDPLGLTAHLIDEGVDTGPIIRFEEHKPRWFENSLEFYNRLFKYKPKMFYEVVNAIENNSVRYLQQKEHDGTHHYPLDLDMLIEANKRFKEYKKRLW